MTDKRLPVCNPMYQERRLDGVWAHLELDPKRGTVLVPDTACKDAEPCIVCGAPTLEGIGHDIGCMAADTQNVRKARAGRLIRRAAERRRRRYAAWHAHADYLEREYPAQLVREAAMLVRRLYFASLGAL